MKKVLLLTVFIALSIITISCGESSQSKKNLEYWTFFTGGDGEFMRELVNQYNN